MGMMTIGQVAKISGLGIETIRFYERKGLIAEPGRKESGYRQYDVHIIDRLQFIQQAKGLGFTLTEIHELLSLELKPGTTSKDIKVMAESKLKDVNEKLKILKRIQRTLKKLVKDCDGNSPISHCPILNAIKSK